MSRKELQTKLNIIDDINDFYDFVYDAKTRNDTIGIKVKTLHYFPLLGEVQTLKRGTKLNTDVLLTVLGKYIKELNDEINDAIGDK